MNHSQKQDLQQLTDTFHTWHRRIELPRYSVFLKQLADEIDLENDVIDPRFINDLMLTTRQFREAIFACHPIKFSAELLQSLSSKQIDQMKKSYLDQQQQRRDDIQKLSKQQRIDKATKNTTKWISRANLKLDTTQSNLLRDTITQQMRPSQNFIDERDNWSEDFFELLNHSNQSNFDLLFAQAIEQRWTLFGSANPEIVQGNRSLWLNFTQDLVVSLSPKQRIRFSDWLKKMAVALSEISQESRSLIAVNAKKAAL